MATFVRVGIREERWFPDDAPWLQAGEVPADALRDLSTKGNALSVFELDDGIEVGHIIAAWFAVGPSHEKPVDVGYVLFSEERVRNIGIRIERTLGTTADPLIDSNHRDLVELSVRRVAELATIMAAGDSGVLLDGELLTALKQRLSAGRLDRQRIVNKKLLQRIETP